MDHGFLRDSTGSFTTIDVPGSLSTTPNSINTAGAITGTYTTGTPPYNYVYHGFVRDSTGTITTFDPTGSQATLARGINAAGVIAGYYYDASGIYRGFLRESPGVFTTFDPPGSVNTEVDGINTAGAITGYYYDANDVVHGFVRDSTGDFTTFDPPGSTYTDARSISDAGAITGRYYDEFDVGHGYLRDSAGAFTTFDAPEGSILPESINTAGAITGSYTTGSFPNDMIHGFLYVASSPAEQINGLTTAINSFNLPSPGMANSLNSHLQAAAAALQANNTDAACGIMGAFINQVNAQSGKNLTTVQAQQLLASANEIRTSIGCP